MSSDLSSISINRFDGTEDSLASYQGDVLLIVNVASLCGLTAQYDGLQKIHEKYRDRGFTVLGFPANEFKGQEPGSDEEIQQFCRTSYGVTFPVFAKIVVKGEGQHPLYRHLTTAQPEARTNPNGSLRAILVERGLLSGEPNDILWNFEKFLVSRHGDVVARFAPDVTPEDPLLLDAIEEELARD